MAITHRGPKIRKSPPPPKSLRKILANCKRIVFITGAGISTGAGLLDYRSLARTRLSSNRALHVSVYNSEQSKVEYFRYVHDMYTIASQANPTAFHNFMNEIASEGRLVKNYSQNIDCLERPLPALEQKTIPLHGRVNTLICGTCQDEKAVTTDEFLKMVDSECTGPCRERNKKRAQRSLRTFTLGRYRPKIVLYDDPSSNPDEETIFSAFTDTLRRRVDAVVIAGTRLQATTTRKFTRDLCTDVRNRGGKTIYVGYHPHSVVGLSKFVDETLKDSCDKVVF